MLPLDSPRRTRADLKSSELGLKLFALGPGQFSAKMNGSRVNGPFDRVRARLKFSARPRPILLARVPAFRFRRCFYESDVTDKVKQGIMGERNNVLFTARSAVHV